MIPFQVRVSLAAMTQCPRDGLEPGPVEFISDALAVDREVEGDVGAKANLVPGLEEYHRMSG